MFGRKSDNGASDGIAPHVPADVEKNGYQYEVSSSPTGIAGETAKLSDPEDKGHSLHRDLSARQVSMIAIGGAIGTGQKAE